MGNGNLHERLDPPVLVMGGANGRIKGQNPDHDAFNLTFDAVRVLISESPQAVCGQHDVDPSGRKATTSVRKR
jgi:hypothetical protein